MESLREQEIAALSGMHTFYYAQVCLTVSIASTSNVDTISASGLNGSLAFVTSFLLLLRLKSDAMVVAM